MSSYNNYLSNKLLLKPFSTYFVCKTGDKMSGDLNMSCNDLKNVDNISFCDGSTINSGASLLFNNKIKIDSNGNLTFVNSGDDCNINIDQFTSTQGTCIPSAQMSLNNSVNPFSLMRTSIYTSDVSFGGIVGGDSIQIQFTNEIVNQLGLTVSGTNNTEISPSSDISGQYVELYLNTQVTTDGETEVEFDISGIEGAPFNETIDYFYTKNSRTTYVTFGPHMFTPDQWSGTSKFVFNINNLSGSGVLDITINKIIFKSYYL